MNSIEFQFLRSGRIGGIVTFAIIWSHLAAVLAADWSEVSRIEDPEWFRSEEGRAVTKQVIRFQYPSGGWPKNIDMSSPENRDLPERLMAGPDQSTIDNGATYTQLEFLARAHLATGDTDVKEAISHGLGYLFTSQLDCGGWPVFYPRTGSYYGLIHYNDNSVVGVLRLMRAVANSSEEWQYLDGKTRSKAREALEKGIQCILDTQVIVDGIQTVWCAQHDPVTLAPAKARAFEPVSLSGMESAYLVLFLMSLEQPDSKIQQAVNSAVKWFEETRIRGYRLEKVTTGNGADRLLIPDEDAPDLWARFYEIGTNRPIFMGRDEILHYDYMRVERERRNGYRYYTEAPSKVLKTYPQWLQTLSKSKNPSSP